MHIDYAGLAKKIVRTRKAQNVTQEQLAEMVGVSHSFIGKFECGRTNSIGLKTLMKISNALNVGLDHLLSDSLTHKPSGTDAEIYSLMLDMNDNDKEFIKNLLLALQQHKSNIKKRI